MTDALILKAARDIMNKRCVSAAYTSTDLSIPDCRVRLDHDVVLQPSSYDARVVETGSTITAIYDDVGEPPEDSTFLIDGVTWIVKRITDNDRIFVTMAVIDA